MQLKNPLHTKPWIIAGPCSAESQEQVIATANRLKNKIHLFRAGVWKPRTKPNSFEGIGKRSFKMVKRSKSANGPKSNYRSSQCSTR